MVRECFQAFLIRAQVERYVRYSATLGDELCYQIAPSAQAKTSTRLPGPQSNLMSWTPIASHRNLISYSVTVICHELA